MKIKLNRYVIRVLIAIFVAVVVLCAVLHLVRAWDHNRYSPVISEGSVKSSDLYEDEDEALTYINGKWYTARDNIETILLLGLDKFEESVLADVFEYSNHQQADFILLLILDHANKTYTTLQVNRDSMAEIPIFGVDGKPAGTKTAQLALAHTYGSGKSDSCKNTALAVSGYLYGVNIDHYISLTMDAVAMVNDLVGGVPVSVLDDLTPVDPALVKDVTVTLTGSQALTYVRARGGLEDSSNLRRMDRQRQYLHALHQQIEAKMTESDDFLIDAIFDISQYLVSDCTANQLSSIGDFVLDYNDKGIQTIEGEAVKGDEYMEFYADEEALKNQVLTLFYTEAEDPPAF